MYIHAKFYALLFINFKIVLSLQLFFTIAILAFSLADEIETNDDLRVAASVNVPVHHAPRSFRRVVQRRRSWNPQNPQNSAQDPARPDPVQNSYSPIDNEQISYNQPQNNNNQNNWSNNGNNVQNSWSTAAPNAWNQNQPQNNWNNQQNVWANQPANPSSQNNWNKPANSGMANKPAVAGSQNNWNQNPSPSSSTTTPIPVIKNEQIIGDNGSYKYE